MPIAAISLSHFIDPRGRCNRTGLLTITMVLLAVELALACIVLVYGVEFEGPPAWAIKLALLWTGLAATGKRLHDCGHSAWWIAAAGGAVMAWCFVLTIAFFVALGPTAFDPGRPWFGLVIVSVMLPVLALVLWLHCEPGQMTANTYGPLPGLAGFSSPEAISDTHGDDFATTV